MRDRNEAVDWLRGVAALWVLSYHANLIVQSPKYFSGASLGHWAEVGHRGVELFFVISGFVMAAAMPARGRCDWQGLRRYVVRRSFRIFPAFLTVFAPLAVLGLLTGLGAPDTGSIQDNLLNNVLLLPRDDQTTYIPVVAWTLTHELMFYAVLASAYVSRTLAVWLLLIWGGCCLTLHLAGAVPPGWQMQLSLLNLFFLAGVAAARLRRAFSRSSCAIAVAVFAAGAISLAVLLDRQAGEIVKVDLSLRTLLYLVGFSAFVVSASALSPLRSRRWHAPLRLLGEQSYSLYLIHYPVVIAAAIVLTGLSIGSWLLLPLSAVVSIGVSRALFRLVEKPGIAAGRLWAAKPLGHPPARRAGSLQNSRRS